MKKGMQRRLAILLALLLCLMPVFSLAEGEDAASVPGTMQSELLGALTNGREVFGSFGMRISDLTSDALGAEETELMQTVFELISTVGVTYSLALTPEGVYGRLGLAVQDQDIVDVSAQLTGERALFTTSLTPARVYEVKYDEAAALLGLADIDWEQVSALAQQEIERYASVAVNWAAGIPAPQDGGAQEATDTRDAAAASYTIPITEQKFGELIVAVLEAAKTDDVLKGFVTLEEGETWEGAIEEAIAETKDEWDSEDALTVRVLQDEAGALTALYVGVEEDVFAVEFKAVENGKQVRVAVLEAGKALFDFTLSVGAEMTDTTAALAMNLTAGDETGGVTMSMTQTSEAKIEGDVETVAYTGKVEESVRERVGVEDAEPVTTEVLVTADVVGSAVTEKLGEDFASKTEVAMDMAVTADGELVKLKLVENAQLGSRAYAPRDLSRMTNVNLLAMDDETVSAVMAELQSGLMLAMSKAMSLLPQEALTKVMTAAQEM